MNEEQISVPGLLPNCEADFQKNLAYERGEAVADDAAVEWVASVLSGGDAVMAVAARADAKALITKIRRGEAPGIYDHAYVGRAMQVAADNIRKHYEAAIAELERDRARLNAQIAKERAEFIDANEKLSIKIADLKRLVKER